MSIEKYHSDAGTIYTPACDICGETLPAEDDFYDAVQSKKDAGWVSQKVGGEWEDACIACQNGGG